MLPHHHFTLSGRHSGVRGCSVPVCAARMGVRGVRGASWRWTKEGNHIRLRGSGDRAGSFVFGSQYIFHGDGIARGIKWPHRRIAYPGPSSLTVGILFTRIFSIIEKMCDSPERPQEGWRAGVSGASAHRTLKGTPRRWVAAKPARKRAVSGGGGSTPLISLPMVSRTL